jgi:hypothetical protein
VVSGGTAPFTTSPDEHSNSPAAAGVGVLPMFATQTTVE